jgi:hypothetical protein
MKTIRRIIGIGVVIAAMFAVGQAIANAAPTAKRQRLLQTLRVSDPQLRQAIDQGLARSWTLRDLEARLERSSVIVYLARASIGRGLVGRTRLIGSGSDGWRFISVELDARITGLDLLTVLGHELQHAVEIGNESGVVDEASMAALYRRIGMPAFDLDSDHSFETRQAIDTGRRVHLELLGLV